MNEIHNRHRQLLEGLDKPELPAQLSSREFLESIYERALDRSTAVLEVPLRKTLTGVKAPADVPWYEPERPSLSSEGIRQLPRRPAPGLLWPRIRADLRSSLRQRRRAKRLRLAVIAAALLISSAIWFRDRSPQQSEEVLIREISVDGPFQTLYSQRDIVKAITRSD